MAARKRWLHRMRLGAYDPPIWRDLDAFFEARRQGQVTKRELQAFLRRIDRLGC